MKTQDRLRLERSFASYYTGRWGSVINVLADLRDVQPVLTAAWSEAKWLEGSRGFERLERTEAVSNAASLTRIVGSRRFWATTEVVWMLQSLLDNLMSWCEGCTCHQDAMAAPTRWKRQRRYMEMAGMPLGAQLASCPLKGCRAPEIACGDHEARLAEAASQTYPDVLACLPRDLGDEDTDHVMHIWTVGKSIVEQSVSQKTQFWSLLPHRLCGLAHHDRSKVSQTANDCLRMWDTQKDEGEQHRLSKLFLAPGGPIRPYVEALRAGASLDAQPTWFQIVVLRFSLVAVAERAIEEKHARLQRYVLRSRNTAGAYVSLSLRLPEIMERMDADATMFQSMVSSMDNAARKNMLPTLRTLGLHGHELCRGLSEVTHKVATLITYHLAPSSQLHVHPANADTFSKAGKDKRKRIEQAQRAARKLGYEPVAADSPIRRLRAELIRLHEKECGSHHRVLSVAMPRSGTHCLQPLCDATSHKLAMPHAIASTPFPARPPSTSSAAASSSSPWIPAPASSSSSPAPGPAEAATAATPHKVMDVDIDIDTSPLERRTLDLTSSCLAHMATLFYLVVNANISRQKLLRTSLKSNIHI